MPKHPKTGRFISQADYDALTKRRGGSRPGAGRSSIEGMKKKLTITLPDEKWSEIQSLVDNGEYSSLADYFRQKELESV